MPTSVVFLGTSAFAVPSLRALAQDPAFKVELVITQPDRPVGRKQILTPSPVKLLAHELSLPIEQPENINAEFLTAHSSQLKAHFLVVVSYGQILTEKILSLPSIAPLNLHASLLPLLRGASPLQHAILEGMKESGVTVQRIVRELDAGPILAQKKVLLDPRETYQTLHDRLAMIGADLLVQTMKHPLTPIDQDPSKVTVCKKLMKENGIANPTTMTAGEIDRRVRALTPWPGVTIGQNKILRTSLSDTKESLRILCKDTTELFIEQIQPPSGKPMSGKAFSLGHTLHY